MMLTIYEYPHLVYDLDDYNGDYPVEFGPYPIGILDGYEGLVWRRKYQGVGEFSLKMPFSEDAAAKLVCGNLIGQGASDDLYRITQITIDTDARGVEYIEAKGKALLGMLSKRVSQFAESNYSTIASTIRQYIVPGNGATDVDSILLYAYDVIGDIADAEYGDRRLPALYWRDPTFDDGDEEEDGGFVRVTVEKLDNVLSALIDACKTGNCGARIVAERATEYADTFTLYFQLYRGTDRSASQSAVTPIVFDRKLGNVAKISYTHNIDGVKTAGYAMCNHIETLAGNTGALVDIMSGNNYTTTNLDDVNGGSGLDRAEIGLKVTELTMPTSGTTNEKINALYASCKDIGKAEIAKSPEEKSIKVTISPNAAWPRYRVDYDLGDTVTFSDTIYGIAMDAQISEVVETYEPGKAVRVELILGTSTTTLLDSVKRVARRRG